MGSTAATVQRPGSPPKERAPDARSGYRFGMVLKDKTPGEAADEAHAASRRAFEKRPYKKTQSLPLRAVMWETTARGGKSGRIPVAQDSAQFSILGIVEIEAVRDIGIREAGTAASRIPLEGELADQPFEDVRLAGKLLACRGRLLGSCGVGLDNL